MKNQFKQFIYFLTISLLITACSKDDIEVLQTGDYQNGYFILNEGGSALPSPITYVSESGEVTEDPYGSVNVTENRIGSFLQDLFFDDSKAFITSSSANSVTVFDRNTLEFETTVTENMENPRYGVVYNNKAYVTNSGSFSTTDDDYVAIINLSTYETEKVVIGKAVNRITEINGLIYVSNGSFGSGTSITILNPSNLNGSSTIEFGEGNAVNTFEEKDGSLYVLTAGFEVAGKVFKINASNNTIESSVDIPASLSSPKHLDIEGSKVYFTSGTSVYGYELGSTSVSETPIATYTSTSQFGSMYGFSVKNNVIYISDAGDFVSSGTAYEYSLEGSLLREIKTDVSPNSFHFNE